MNTIVKQENFESDEEELLIRNSWYRKHSSKWSKKAAIKGRSLAQHLGTMFPDLAGPARNNLPSELVDTRNLLITNN